MLRHLTENAPTRRAGFLFAVAALLVPAVFGQGPATAAASPPQTATPVLEVATIKPVKDPDPNRAHDTTEGRRLFARNYSLRDLIRMAYEVDPEQIEGGPKWITTDKWDIDAEAVEGVNLDEEREEEALLKELLAGRFRLAFHWEKKILPVYVLTVAKNGPKLKSADSNESENSGCPQPGVCTFRKRTLSDFSWYMQYVVLDRPVVDRTGITGQFDFSLKWTPDESQFSRLGWIVKPPADAQTPSLFTAIQEQLGLKLEPEKMPAEVLVIDKVERPTEN
jgi:uncharacterized protein (TIGR03435 family)